uniref:Uncharacterized protein n=1 Tax=viral metagenome TaxID=1070528 RepID=A0A6C0F6P4_9ZZZZ|tara:strand:- start:2952 stop:3764 length:813 start_codon:yes stop_codon:yes gene_type:complete
MSITLSIIKTTPIRNYKREYLNYIAELLSIDPKDYKNKNVLYEKIINTKSHNSCDPITLEDINEIDVSLLIGWIQNNHNYVAKIESMYEIFKSGHTINPFAIDIATGIQQAESGEDYNNKFDLCKITNLKERVCNAAIKLNLEYNIKDECDIPDIVKWRFTIFEAAPNLYCAHIIEYIEKLNSVKAIALFELALYNVIVAYRHSLLHESLTEQSLTFVHTLSQLHNGMQYTQIETNPLHTIHNLLQMWKVVLNENIMELIMDYVDKIISQ